MMKNKKVLFLALTILLTIIGGNQALAYSQSERITACTTTDLANMSMELFDAPLSTFTDGTTRYWLHSENSGDTFQMFTGTLDAPCGALKWEKTRAQLFTNASTIQGMPWIVSTYKDTNGLLAFIHVEHAGANASKGKIGLAWSTDNGNTFTYLGDIIIPFGDPDEMNIQGAPYFVMDGYFYVYYSDNNAPHVPGASVARSKVTDVIQAAMNGTVSDWYKYYDNDWTEPGLGGQFTPIADAEGITHTSAAYSTYTNKYYFVTTIMGWYGSQSPTWIKLWESTDGIHWTLTRTIAEDESSNVGPNAGYQYVTIVGTDGSSNGTVGQTFYVYSGLNPYHSDKSIKRWTVDLGGSSPAPNPMPINENLAYNLAYSSSSNIDGNQTADKAFDGDPNGLTNWQAAAGSNYGEQWLEVDFGTNRTFNKAVLTEYGNRTQEYRIEYWDGAAWFTAYTGTTIGDWNSPRTVVFPEVIGSKARIKFMSGSITPIIYEFEIYHQTVSPNLAEDKSYSSSSDADANQTAEKAFDQLFPTNWQSAPGVSGQWLEVDFGANTSFNKAVLNEYGNLTTGYRIEYWDGSGWHTAYTGTTIGNNNELKTISFPTVTGSKARIYFTSGTGAAILYEFELFKEESATNLSHRKTAYSSSSNLDATQTAERAFDGSLFTNWQAAAGTSYNGQWLEVDFGENRTFDRAVITEYDNRTTGYQIQYWNGTGWLTAFTGTTIGDANSPKTVTFTAVTGSKARLYFTSGTVTPIIYEFELYRQ